MAPSFLSAAEALAYLAPRPRHTSAGIRAAALALGVQSFQLIDVGRYGVCLPSQPLQPLAPYCLVRLQPLQPQPPWPQPLPSPSGSPSISTSPSKGQPYGSRPQLLTGWPATFARVKG